MRGKKLTTQVYTQFCHFQSALVWPLCWSLPARRTQSALSSCWSTTAAWPRKGRCSGSGLTWSSPLIPSKWRWMTGVFISCRSSLLQGIRPAVFVPRWIHTHTEAPPPTHTEAPPPHTHRQTQPFSPPQKHRHTPPPPKPGPPTHTHRHRHTHPAPPPHTHTHRHTYTCTRTQTWVALPLLSYMSVCKMKWMPDWVEFWLCCSETFW